MRFRCIFDEESKRLRLHDCRGPVAVPGFRLGAVALALAIACCASAQEAFFKMNEPSWSGSAPQVVDSTGHGNDGTAVGGANTVSDPTYGQVGGFDGSGQYVQVGGNTTISGPWTVTAWINIPAFSTYLGMPIAVAGVSGAGDFFGVGGTGGENWGVPQYSLYVDNWGSQDYSSSGQVTPGVWNFVTFVSDGANTINFYIDGASAGSFVGANIYSWNINTFTLGGATIGGSTTNASLTGDLRDVGIWTSELSGGQVQSLYQAEAVPEPAPLAAFAVAGISLLIRRRKK